MKKIRISIVDDHQLIREVLAKILNAQPNFKVISEASNGKELMAKLVKKVIPDIVILDLNMPEMDGFETLNYLKKAHPSIKVIVLSMYGDNHTKAFTLENGADLYLLKNCDIQALIDSILTITKDDWNKTSLYENDKVLLSKKQMEILKLVCKGVNSKEIGEKLFLSPRTVEDNRLLLNKYFNAKNTAHLTHIVSKKGIFSVL